MTKSDDEHQKLIDSKSNSYDNDRQYSSRLEWAESSWTRCLYLLCWWWISPVLSIGYKRLLTDNDLDGLPHDDQSSVLLKRLQSNDWTTTSTWRIIVKVFWKEYVYVALLCIPYLIVRIAQPLLLRQVIRNIMNREQSSLSIYILAISLSLCVLIQAVLDHQINFRSMRVGMRIRSVLISFIFTRSLSMKSTSWQHIDRGRIVNMIAVDAYRFEEICSRLHILWEAPLELIIIFGFLCWIMHPIPVLVSYTIFFLFFFTVLFIGHFFGKYRDLKHSCSDQYIHAYNEFIHGFHVIKMYNWEKPMEDRINQIRQNQSNNLQRIQQLRAINISQSYILLPLLALTTFGTAWLLHYPLNSADCFAALSFFSLIRNQFMFLMPIITERVKEVQIASKRIDSFIQLTIIKDRPSSSPTSSIDPQPTGKIVMSNASFSWHDNIPCLSSLNLTIEPGILVGIVGPVGSGKSSLLAAILDEMDLINGQINTNGSSFSYTAQSPWIFVDTLRNNILFNRAFVEQRYRDVIYACCLDIDLASFGSSGDLTIIGERGVNLSEGQKARVSLARALYADADIYLIDDPLAAVDRTVAKQIYERCFSSNGFLKNKTRLLVTHQTQFLHEADQLIFLSDGHIDEQGHLDENLASKDDHDQNKTSELISLLDESIPDTQSIIAEEKLVSENVSWDVWSYLFTKSPLGKCGFGLLIILLLLTEIFYHSANYWLSLWLQQSYEDQQRLTIYPYVYFTLIIGIILTDILRTNYFFFVLLHGANRLHNDMLKGLLRTSVQFFESNPSGRILNRISRDQKIVDELLPTMLLLSIEAFLMSIGSVITMCFIRPYILVLFIALVPVFVWLCKYYLKSRRELRRLEIISRSPIYDLLASSLNGLTIIRVFKAEDHLIKLFTDRLDRNVRAYMNMQGSSRWFAVRLNLLTFLNTFIITILLIIYRDRTNPTLIALFLTYLISIPKSFQLAIQQWSEVSLLMTSAERIHEYGQLPSEEDRSGSQKLVYTSPKWPAHGKIEFCNYSLRHRSSLDSVLKNINVQVETGEKIGIIGRTGAGKSSLFKGIFRFLPQSNIDGKILIDDIDISRITLNHLRSHLSIIPQQPILFSGTLRYNLDPFHHYSDEQCWSALEDVQLKQFVSQHSADLQMPIGESGNNLSVGQCQLICVARAILKKSKILLIDEATANVDEKTDEIIQEVFTNKFQDRTVLTIAHRLNTVAACDRIIVLDKGVIVNIDTPMNILQHYQ
jgi:ATP-binding cassette subfamily C (CFTR/MRP) protein 4